MGIDCWELFSRLCWTLLMSDALNGALLLFPGTSCSLRDDSTQLQLHTPPQPPKPFTIFSHPPLHIPAIAVLGLFFVSPLFFSLHTWRAELDRPSSLISLALITALQGLSSLLQPSAATNIISELLLIQCSERSHI